MKFLARFTDSRTTRHQTRTRPARKSVAEMASARRNSMVLQADSRSAVEFSVGTNGARMQWHETSLDHRACVEVLQPPDVGKHQLRRLGCKYVHDRGTR